MRRIIVFLAALSVLAACQKEKGQADVRPVDERSFSFKVKADVPEEETKTYLGTDRTVLWGSGEQMQLAVTAAGNHYFAASASTEEYYTGLASATFGFNLSLPAAGNYLFQGIYPASAVVAEENGNPSAYKVLLPSVQDATEGKYDPSAFIMVARPKAFTAVPDEWTAAFRRAVALNTLTLQGIPSGKSVRRVELVAPEGVSLSGTRAMNLSNGESGAMVSGSRNVEVRYASPLAGGADINVWFTSWAADFAVGSSFTVIAYTSDDFSYTKEVVVPAGHAISLQEGKLNTFIVDLTGITPEACYFSGGNGSQASPWRIETVQDLADMADFTSAGDTHFNTDYYRQTADIDYAGGYHEAIGNSNSTPSYFKGTYEGNGYKVSNLVIRNQQTDKAVGFFGYLDSAAHVDGLVLENATVNSTTWNNGTVVGCIQGSSTVVVENCVVTGGSVTSNNTDNGGICGKQMSGTIRNCTYQGTVTGTASAKHRVGGIAGQVCAAGALVEGCHFDGTASGACGNVGGIVGSMYGSAFVKGCSASAATVVEGGSVSDNGINIGGIVGYIDNRTGGAVENCEFPGTVKGHYYEVGGIVGRDQGLVIRSCTFSGSVSSDWDESGAADDTYGRLGGICGHVHGTGYVENCTVSGTVGADDKRVSYTGGVVGWLEVGSVVGCNIPSGKTLVVKGKATVGGVVGQFKSGLVKSCTLNGLTVNASGNYVGGVAGRMNVNASLTNCSLVNSTVSNSGMCAGGIAGLFSGGGYIAQCSVSGSSVTAGTKLAGGILGNMDSCTSAASSKVERCTVEGGTGLAVTTTTDGNAGGILGGCNTYGAINLCTASINVTSPDKSNVGGIVGWTNTANVVIANCVYYGGELSAPNGSGVAGIAGQFSYSSSTMGNSILVNCCSFPSKVSSKSNNQSGIGGYVNTVTIKNCYCPTPYTSFYYNGANTGAGSQGSIYGWLRGNTTSDVCSGVLEDVYWLSGWKAGNFNANYTYVKSEQSLTDAQMRSNGSVTRPSNSTVYASFLEALNAAANDYNAAPVFDVRAVEWVMGTNGYPVPYGTTLAGSSAVSSKVKVSLLGDSITTYQGWTAYPNNYEYPKASSYPDFTSVTQTWWYQLIYERMSNAVLEVNSSFTGTQIQDHASQGHPGYGFLQRYVDLGNPDIIFINGGTNDISRDLPLGSLDFSIPTDQLDTYQFAQAYDKLIRLVKARYPNARIVCVIGDRYFDGVKANGQPAADIVREICDHYDVLYAEVNYGEQRSTCRYSDGANVHPTPAGMSFMADAVWNVITTLY
ncbi:MAG: hypothetical protein IK008_03605 [Bacteroidales bacterium]|nr:hypothetical protein [Bacteroidales bacterium]